MMNNARNTDPETSHKAGRRVALRAGSQRAKLLAAYDTMPFPLIDEEAAHLAGITNPKACYWKRCGELRQMGYLEWAKINGVIYEKKSSADEWCGASQLTEAGRQMLRELKGQ